MHGQRNRLSNVALTHQVEHRFADVIGLREQQESGSRLIRPDTVDKTHAPKHELVDHDVAGFTRNGMNRRSIHQIEALDDVIANHSRVSQDDKEHLSIARHRHMGNFAIGLKSPRRCARMRNDGNPAWPKFWIGARQSSRIWPTDTEGHQTGARYIDQIHADAAKRRRDEHLLVFIQINAHGDAAIARFSERDENRRAVGRERKITVCSTRARKIDVLWTRFWRRIHSRHRGRTANGIDYRLDGIDIGRANFPASCNRQNSQQHRGKLLRPPFNHGSPGTP